MSDSENYKAKIVNRIKAEKIEYIEKFKPSLINQYTYMRKQTVNYKKETIKHSIIAPCFTDDSISEQAYKLAHELGHYYFYKKLNSVLLKIVLSSNNSILTYIIEREAWKEAKKICGEESISIEDEFFLVRSEGLGGYFNEIIRRFKKVIASFIRVIEIYFVSLFWSYFVYKATNDNITDLFGLFNCLKGITLRDVENFPFIITAFYLFGYILDSLFKKSDSH
jgi:hypothetical protein